MGEITDIRLLDELYAASISSLFWEILSFFSKIELELVHLSQNLSGNFFKTLL